MKIIAMEAENQRLLSVHKRMVKSPNNRTKNNANLILPFMYLRTFKFNNQEIDTLKEDANKYHFRPSTSNIRSHRTPTIFKAQSTAMINVKAYCKAAFLIFKYSALVSLQHQGKRYTKLKPTKIDTKVSYSRVLRISHIFPKE